MRPVRSGRPKQSRRADYLVDANIFLELELGQERADTCEEVLRKFCSGELQGLLLDFAVDSIVIIMESHGKGWEDIRTFLSSLLGYKGLYVYYSSLLDRIMATDHMRSYGLDFDDALALQAMKESGIRYIVSYDKDFDKVPDIKRLKPESLLQRA